MGNGAVQPSPSTSKAPPARIRRATAADRAGLEMIEATCFSGDRLSPRSLRTLIARPSASVLVADTTDGLVGTVLVLYRRTARTARIYSLAVLPSARGSGLARQLMAAAEADAASRGVDAVRLEVRADNGEAIGLYRKLGYRQIGKREAYYEDGGDALRFERCLAAPSRSGSSAEQPPRRPPRPGAPT